GAAPVRAAALQFDLIAEPLPWTETGRHIVDFEGIAVPWELEVLQLRLAERRDVLWLTRDTDATDDNRWRARGRIVRGNDSDHPGAVAEPQSSRTIPKGGVQFANRQTLALAVRSDQSGCRVQPIESAPGRGVYVSGGVLDDCGHFVARKPLRCCVPKEHRAFVRRTVDADQTTTIACGPEAAARVREQIPNRAWRNAFLAPEPLESFVAVPDETSISTEPDPDVPAFVFTEAGYVEPIERESVAFIVVMQCATLALPSRQTIAQAFPDRGNPHVAARVLEEAKHDVGRKPVTLRVARDRFRASDLLEVPDAVVPEHAVARADPPVALAVHQNHLIPAPGRDVMERKLRHDRPSVGISEESPKSRHLHHNHAVAGSLEHGAGISNAVGFTEHREFRRRDFGDPHQGPGPQVSHSIFSDRLHCRWDQSERFPERPQAIAVRFRRRDNLHQAAYGGRPEYAVARFEELMDPSSGKAVLRRVRGSNRRTRQRSIRDQHGESVRSRSDPDAPLSIHEDGIHVVRR